MTTCSGAGLRPTEGGTISCAPSRLLAAPPGNAGGSASWVKGRHSAVLYPAHQRLRDKFPRTTGHHKSRCGFSTAEPISSTINLITTSGVIAGSFFFRFYSLSLSIPPYTFPQHGVENMFVRRLTPTSPLILLVFLPVQPFIRPTIWWYIVFWACGTLYRTLAKSQFFTKCPIPLFTQTTSGVYFVWISSSILGRVPASSPLAF